MRCEHFKRTDIKLSKHTLEAECRVCPLRNKAGDCIKDIMDRKGLEIESEISEIWRVFYEQQRTIRA